MDMCLVVKLWLDPALLPFQRVLGAHAMTIACVITRRRIHGWWLTLSVCWLPCTFESCKGAGLALQASRWETGDGGLDV